MCSDAISQNWLLFSHLSPPSPNWHSQLSSLINLISLIAKCSHSFNHALLVPNNSFQLQRLFAIKGSAHLPIFSERGWFEQKIRISPLYWMHHSLLLCFYLLNDWLWEFGYTCNWNQCVDQNFLKIITY